MRLKLNKIIILRSSEVIIFVFIIFVISIGSLVRCTKFFVVLGSLFLPFVPPRCHPKG